jgi:hypothetical protein
MRARWRDLIIRPQADAAVDGIADWLRAERAIEEQVGGPALGDAEADPTAISGRLKQLGELSEESDQLLHRGIGGGMYTRKAHATREAPRRGQR